MVQLKTLGYQGSEGVPFIRRKQKAVSFVVRRFCVRVGCVYVPCWWVVLTTVIMLFNDSFLEKYIIDFVVINSNANA